MEFAMDLDVPARPALSTSKQNRINIWRNEVACATDPLEMDGGHEMAPSSTAASTITSNTASSTASPPLSRPRSLWSRFSRRLSILTRGSSALESDSDRSPRTAMYREVPDAVALAALNGEAKAGDMPLGAESDSGRAGGLKEKQERLERAARLLDQGPQPDA